MNDWDTDELVLIAALVGIIGGMLVAFLLILLFPNSGPTFETRCANAGGIVASHEHGKGEHDYFCIKGNRVILNG